MFWNGHADALDRGPMSKAWGVRLPSELPIVQAPMAGGPSTPALTAAVANAGGYGTVAAGYLTAHSLREAIATTRTMTAAPFGVNLCMPSVAGDPTEIATYAALLQPEAERLAVALTQSCQRREDLVVFRSGGGRRSRPGDEARRERQAPIRRPLLVRQRAARDRVEPRQRFGRHLAAPAPGDRERLSRYVLGGLGIGSPQRKGVHLSRVYAEVRFEEPFLVDVHNPISPAGANLLQVARRSS